MQFACICDYCGSIYPFKVIRKHEASCTYNPKNKACFTCKHCYTDFDRIIKCSRKKIVSTTFISRDLVTSNCESHEEGHPHQVVYL